MWRRWRPRVPPTPRSPRGCSSARAPSITTCARSSGSWTSRPVRSFPVVCCRTAAGGRGHGRVVVPHRRDYAFTWCRPLVTIVTDNGGPFRSFRFEAFIATRPELRHVRTRVRTPGQNGSRERGFGSLKYEKLFLEDIPDALDLVRHAEDYRLEDNTVRPHEALAWNRPHDVHTGQANPRVPKFPEPENLPIT
ncbi:integrase core domain-containing protein [Streptomyces sp. NPDC046977]|uniref:integrase core domain-containing protein n=1 Tax=Streptomyces sp. NPDC046977 TaxID=3154703 RepID=UPI0033E1DA26